MQELLILAPDSIQWFLPNGDLEQGQHRARLLTELQHCLRPSAGQALPAPEPGSQPQRRPLRAVKRGHLAPSLLEAPVVPGCWVTWGMNWPQVSKAENCSPAPSSVAVPSRTDMS